MNCEKVKVLVLQKFDTVNLADNPATSTKDPCEPNFCVQSLYLYQQRHEFVLFVTTLQCSPADGRKIDATIALTVKYKKKAKSKSSEKEII